MDLSTQPYQVLRYHTNAIRSVAYHLRYPLFASCSDDTSVVVSHGMVYNDLLQNPLIVPVKQLRGHTKYDDFGVMNIVWHPFQPWLFSAGADGYIKLWTWTLENKIDFGFVKGQNNLKSIFDNVTSSKNNCLKNSQGQILHGWQQYSSKWTKSQKKVAELWNYNPEYLLFSDLAPFLGDLSQSEKLSEIKPPLPRLTWLIHTSFLPSKWNLYLKLQFLA